MVLRLFAGKHRQKGLPRQWKTLKAIASHSCFGGPAFPQRRARHRRPRRPGAQRGDLPHWRSLPARQCRKDSPAPVRCGPSSGCDPAASAPAPFPGVLWLSASSRLLIDGAPLPLLSRYVQRITQSGPQCQYKRRCDAKKQHSAQNVKKINNFVLYNKLLFTYNDFSTPVPNYESIRAGPAR